MASALRGVYHRMFHRVERPAPAGRLAYLEAGNQWYAPAIAGTSSLVPHVVGGSAVRRADAVLRRLDCDAYHRFVMNFYATGLERLGDGWMYADLYTALSGLTSVLRPRTYLEVGVRRGHSMAMVAAHAPDCALYGLDLWVSNYAGLDNPGKAFVAGQLQRVDFRGRAEFIDGDSARTLPTFFRSHPDLFFDLITVDGDHSARGARVDLRHVLPRLKLGGVVVFDDLINPTHAELRGVWDEVVGGDARFASWSFVEAGFGVAFAVRTRA